MTSQPATDMLDQGRGRTRSNEKRTKRLYEIYKIKRPLFDTKGEARKATILDGIRESLWDEDIRDMLDRYETDGELPITPDRLHKNFKEYIGKDYDK